MGTAAQTRLDGRRREQSGHVEHAARPRRLLHGAADGRVVDVDDDGHVVAQVAYQHRRLDVAQVAALRAHDGSRPGQPGLPQVGAVVRVEDEMGHVPRLHGRRQAWIVVVIEHDDRHAGQVQLLHRAQADALQPADDHVAHPVAQRHVLTGAGE